MTAFWRALYLHNALCAMYVGETMYHKPYSKHVFAITSPQVCHSSMLFTWSCVICALPMFGNMRHMLSSVSSLMLQLLVEAQNNTWWIHINLPSEPIRSSNTSRGRFALNRNEDVAETSKHYTLETSRKFSFVAPDILITAWIHSLRRFMLFVRSS